MLQLQSCEERVMNTHVTGYVKSGYFVIDEVELDSGYYFRLSHGGVKTYSMTLSGVVLKSVTLSSLEKGHILDILDMIPKQKDGFSQGWDTYYNRSELCHS